MPTLRDRILEVIRHTPLDDDVLAARLGVGSRQAVNQAARRLEREGHLRRRLGSGGKIVNEWLGASTGDAVVHRIEPSVAGLPALLSEDEVKESVRRWLVAQGFVVTVAMGRERGIDLDAHHPDGRRWVVEAKAEVGSDQQQGNYFLGVLGELLQRMDDPGAVYALALPDNRRYRGLVNRLPRLAKTRLGLVVVWVGRTSTGNTVTAEAVDSIVAMS